MWSRSKPGLPWSKFKLDLKSAVKGRCRAILVHWSNWSNLYVCMLVLV